MWIIVVHVNIRYVACDMMLMHLNVLLLVKNGEKQFGLLKLYSFEPLNTVKLDEFTRFASK